MKILDENPEIDVLFGNFKIVDFHTGQRQFNFFDKKKILHSLKFVKIGPDIKILEDNLFEALLQENFLHFGSSIIRKSSIVRKIFNHL